MIVLALVAVVAFQCPDGSPPPCSRAPARATAPAADPRRIAILPFRVTGADTSLSEGIAELLAAEFTGESGPRAVHMGTAIRGWRTAGGGARQPLTQPAAMRAVRQMGAASFVDGSIVGIGNRLTVTASVVSSVDGQSRRAEPIRGSSDSLDVLIGRLAATVLGLAGGESREGTRGVLTSSTAAMRAYLEGMSEWRRGRTNPAAAAFEHAFGEDSSFARAALMRYWIANWFGQGVATQWANRVFALRERLSSADRLLVVALLGERYPVPRLPAVSYGDRQRAATLLPESPEAQYLAGDWLFHYGAAIDATDGLERARGYFARSFALDSQQTVLSHLVDAAGLLGDSALLRGLQPVLEARLADMPEANRFAAGYLGDRAWLGRVRGSDLGRGLMMENYGLLPVAVLEELPPPPPMPGAVVAAMQGRPAAARRHVELIPNPVNRHHLVLLAAIAGDVDSATGAEAARALEGLGDLDSSNSRTRSCDLALWRAWQGTDDATPPAWTEGHTSCWAMVELLRASIARAPDFAARLEAADSLVRSRLSPARYYGIENFVLARAWEAQGNRRRALSAMRLYPIGVFVPLGVGPRLREEGRLAAATGDVNRALEAYRAYLDYRKDAEPSMRAERDSVRAAAARLVRP